MRTGRFLNGFAWAKKIQWLTVIAAAGLGVQACGSDTSTSSTGPGGGNGGGGPNGEGLPCDVAELLAAKCWTCHGATPAGGAPQSLASYDDLMAPAKSDASKTNAALSVERMQAMTMPPGGGATAAEIGVLEAWIAAGSPKGTCGAVTDPFGGDVVCTSGKTWAFGEDVSDPMRPQMHPGRACLDCHAMQPPIDAPPTYAVAGTVYPTGHEPDECYGIDGTAMSDVIVQLVDSAGNSFDLKVNATGNFLLDPDIAGPFVPPYTAKVISSAGERAMTSPQTSGDCNACHTEQGNGAGSMAPGRIVIPL